MARLLPHPRIYARTSRGNVASPVRTLIYSPDPARAEWLEQELEGMVLSIGRSIAYVVAALTEDPAPRPQVLVIDLDLLTPGELLELHAIREGGWCGKVIGLGRVPPSLADSLGVDTVLTFPVLPDALRDTVAAIKFDAATTRLPVYTPERS